jgi:putative solute:sodium symporter small subunit
MSDSDAIVLLLLIVGLLFSLYYGFKATKIFRVEASGFPPSVKFHQYWLSFLGSALGWLLFSFGLARVLQRIDRCSNPVGL